MYSWCVYIEMAEGYTRRKTYRRRSVNKSRRYTQNQRVYIINPINRKVNYMHSKRSFPSRSKLRDLFSRIYYTHCRIIFYIRIRYTRCVADPAALNSKLCIGGPIPSYI